MGGGASSARSAQLEAENAQMSQKIRTLEAKIGEMASVGNIDASASVNEQLEAAKAMANEHAATVAAQVAELTAARSKEAEMTSDLEAWREAHAAEAAKSAALEVAQQELEHKMEVAGKALKHVVDYPLAKEEIEQAKQSVPLHPDVDDDTHHALTLTAETDATILPEDLQTAVQAFQQSMRDIEKMKAAVQHSQAKVTEYWQKVQAQENELMNQRVQILTVENQNEELKLSTGGSAGVGGGGRRTSRTSRASRSSTQLKATPTKRASVPAKIRRASSITTSTGIAQPRFIPA